jgi:hypothetical protein
MYGETHEGGYIEERVLEYLQPVDNAESTFVRGENVYSANSIGVIILVDKYRGSKKLKRLIPWHWVVSLTWFGNDSIVNNALVKSDWLRRPA